MSSDHTKSKCHFQEARLRAIEQNRKSPTPDPRIATVPETDDEHDELEEDIVVTHL